ncbi:C45 family autoproteolytic acyltransferase/hydolase [Cerasicoccus frondis]|uniref:C45 family autoproteolytic acyltransferase/hydolase n=1 Tax=Cerasicoccus frondis TaxID=490090 RepID=UPI002852D88F|nr:C45 family autoproteolytic acyltransferase/hydolase [Cerasicoccus frondis]
MLSFDLGAPMHERLASHREVLAATANELLGEVSRQILEAAPKAIHLAHWVNVRTQFRYNCELKALSKLLGLDWRLGMMAGMAYELMTWGCSTAAIATDEGPVLARNMDFWPEDLLARHTWLIHGEKAGRRVYSVAGWPGALGVVTGLSGRGFAFALNAVWSTEGLCKSGYPVMLFLRKVLDVARSFDEAVAMLSRQKLMAACLLTVVGVDNDQRVVIERTPTKYEHRRADGDRALVTTNNYWTDVDAGAATANVLTETSCGRFDTLSAYAEMLDDSMPSDDKLLYALTDPGVIQGITAQHVIARPRRNDMTVYTPRIFHDHAA